MIAVGVASAIFHGAPRGGPFAPNILKENATPEERAKIDAIIAAHAGRITALKQAARAAHRDAFRMLSDPSYDPIAFESALGKAQDADDAVRRESATVIAQSLAQLSPAERQALVDKARRRFAWWRFFRGRHTRE